MRYSPNIELADFKRYVKRFGNNQKHAVVLHDANNRLHCHASVTCWVEQKRWSYPVYLRSLFPYDYGAVCALKRGMSECSSL